MNKFLGRRVGESEWRGPFQIQSTWHCAILVARLERINSGESIELEIGEIIVKDPPPPDIDPKTGLEVRPKRSDKPIVANSNLSADKECTPDTVHLLTVTRNRTDYDVTETVSHDDKHEQEASREHPPQS